MRILVISHYFYPEGNAPATRVYEITRRWAAAGHEVTVVTAAPNVPSGVVYDGYRNRWRLEERIEGVHVSRVWTYLAANAGTVRRILSYLSFMTTSFLRGLRSPRPDLVIATSPQFFCGWSGRLVAKFRRLPFVLEVRDLWPESIVAVGAMKPSWKIRFLEFLERKLYDGARLIVTVGEGYKRKLLERGLEADRIRVLPNGVDLTSFAPDVDGSQVRSEFELENRFVCSVVGTIGMASGLDIVIRAAQSLLEAGRDDVRFLLVGDGSERERLEAAAKREGLSSIVIAGRLPKTQIPGIIAASDACLVHLRGLALFETVMPSKIFEAAAMKRPIILGVAGIAAEWLRAAEAGVCIPPDDETALLTAIDELASDPELRARLGENGRTFVAKHHDYELLAARYLSIVGQLRNGNQTY